MKLNSKAIVEFLGFLAVAASLIFVGMQLMLDRRVAVAEQYYNRAETVKEDLRTYLLSPAYIQLKEQEWALGQRPSYWNEDWEIAKQVNAGELSVSSLFALLIDLQLSIIGYDNIYFQYQQGLIDEDVWQHFRTLIRRWLTDYPEFERAVALRFARPAIRPVIEQMIEEIESGSQ